jgi:hypothetical protein
MTTKTITAVVMALGLVAASPGVAPAGGGGQGLPGGIGNLWQCYNINFGAKPGSVIQDLNDQFTDATQVKLGAAQLLCAPASATTITPSPTAFPPDSTPDHILCYEEQNAISDAAGAVVDIIDPLTPGQLQTVKLASKKYVCVDATATCQDKNDCPILDPAP